VSDAGHSDDVGSVIPKGLSESDTDKEGPRAISGGRTLRVQAFWMATGMLAFFFLVTLVQIVTRLILARLFPLSNGGSFAFHSCVVVFGGGGLLFALAKGRLTGLAGAMSRRYARAGLLARDLCIALVLAVLINDLLDNFRVWTDEPLWDNPLYALEQVFRACAASTPAVLAAVALVRLSRSSPREPAQEESSPFDTNRAIRQWRSHILEFESFSEEDVIELEEHLREEMAVLVDKGSCEREAFAVACRQIGPSNTVEREYGKVNAGLIWRTRAYWLVAGALLIFSTGLLQYALVTFPLVRYAPHVGTKLPLAEVGFWVLAYMVFMHAAMQPEKGAVRWLRRHHEKPWHLILDLTLFVIALGALGAALYSDGYPFGPLSIPQTLFGANAPTLTLFYVGILCLHPSMYRRGQA